MKKEIPKAYNSQEVEDDIYKKWEESGFFNPDNLKLPEGAEKFSISMPPPNATGVLHLGHASFLTHQDLMTRYNRMKQKNTLWLPGTDHASIATQTKVEKIIAKEGKTKYDLGREKFLERVDEYVENSKNIIRNQTRKMGSSCDWSRERYTLDNGLSRAVKEVFTKMYNDKLIYRGDRIVNWCPRCESTLADDEVEHKDQKGKLYYFKYDKDFPITIATTRPETKLGDTAVAVNPKDERYKKYIGKTYKIDLGNGKHKIKIISDREVEMGFGTGALGVTPAHSMTDWEIAEKNNLEKIKIINEDGKMNTNAGKDYEGLTVLEAREKFVKYLEKNNLIEKVEEVDQSLSICYRCETPIEPLPSKQWFVAVDKKITIEGNKYFQNKSLKDVAIEVVKNKEIKIIPERFEKTYVNWMENLHDWCISRQIWFGHRVPVWYRNELGVKKSEEETKSDFGYPKSDFVSSSDFFVGTNPPEDKNWIRDKDTLDTWFSSGLWTFSTLLDQDHKKYKTFEEWVENSPDLKKFHPTSVMETGYDILFFWIARMILMTTYTMGEVPFENVYLHGMVRDKQGKKMSKSLGNGIDPIEMIEKYGTDALRLSMIIGSSPGNDIKMYEEKIEGYRNFVNKLWNISRYVLITVDEKSLELDSNIEPAKIKKSFSLFDNWILYRTQDTMNKVSKKIDNYEFSAACEILKDFTWNEFADWYIEISKIEREKYDKDKILVYVLKNLLKLWHPFAPFITEEIWSKFPEEKMLMIEKWKKAEVLRVPGDVIYEAELVIEIIKAIRSIRAEYSVKPDKKIKAVIYAGNKEELIKSEMETIKKMRTGISELEIKKGGEKIDQAVYTSVGTVEIYLLDLINKEKEMERIKKEIEGLEKYIAQLRKDLSNDDFINNASLEVVEKKRNKFIESEEKKKKLEEKLKSLL